MTATVLPASTFAVWMAAPTPVMTPQPTRQILSSGASSRTLMMLPSGRMVLSANPPTPTPCISGFSSAPSRRGRGPMNERAGSSERSQRLRMPFTQ